MTTLEKELIKAAQDGNRLAVVQLVIDGVDINHVNQYGWTALLTACDRGHSEIAMLIIDKGAKVNDRGHSNSTPLIRAAREGMFAVVKGLLKKGADVNAVDDSNYTPLINASTRGHHDIVDILIKHGANVNDCTSEGLTALHVMARNGNREGVSYLLDNGADLQAKDITGKTALDLATEKGFTDIMRILRAAINRNLLQAEVKTSTQFLNEKLKEIIDRISDLQNQLDEATKTSHRLKQELSRDIECGMSHVKDELFKSKEQMLRENRELDQTKSKLFKLELRLNKVQECHASQEMEFGKRMKNLDGEVYNLKEKVLDLKGTVYEMRNEWKKLLNDKAAFERELEDSRSDLMKMQNIHGNSWKMIDFEVDKLMLQAHLNKVEKERLEDKEAMRDIISAWQTRMLDMSIEMANYRKEKDAEFEQLRRLIVEQDMKHRAKIEQLKKEMDDGKRIDNGSAIECNLNLE